MTDINFIGFDDTACNNCFGPAKVANLVTVTSSGVPEPSTWVLMSSAMLAAVAWMRRKHHG